VLRLEVSMITDVWWSTVEVVAAQKITLMYDGAQWRSWQHRKQLWCMTEHSGGCGRTENNCAAVLAFPYGTEIICGAMLASPYVWWNVKYHRVKCKMKKLQASVGIQNL
jgi:hypothetical protein